MFKKILLAVDGSVESKKAGEYAIEIAKALNGSLTAISVVELPDAATGVPEVQAFEESLYADIKKDAEEILDEFKTEAKSRGIEAAAVLKIGHVWTEIINESENGKYEVIILGSKGLSGIKRMLIGSVAENVARHSKCPVLVVK